MNISAKWVSRKEKFDEMNGNQKIEADEIELNGSEKINFENKSGE